MKELIQNLADDELLDMQEEHKHALNRAMYTGEDWNDLHLELNLIERELTRRARRVA